MVNIEPDVVFPSPNKVMFCVRKNMAAYGIQHLLLANKKKRVPLDPDDELREDLIGLRAARIVNKSSSNQTTAIESKLTCRGSIVRIIRGEKLEDDTFILLLDDGEEDFLDLVSLYGA